MLEISKYIKENGLEGFSDRFGVDVKKHPTYSNLYLFKYSQLCSDMSSRIVQESRGLILDAQSEWTPVCWVLNKFFNNYEPNAAKIDWPSARVFAKEDGSLVNLWHYEGEWRMSTSGSPAGEGNVNNLTKTFSDLFWSTWHDLGYNLPNSKNICYAFELCTRENRIVVDHEKPRVVLLAARNRETGQELPPEPIAKDNGWECVRSYKMNTLKEIMESLKDIDPYKQEGYVVCDAKFNRVKIKAPQYVAIHHVIGSMSRRSILDVVRKGETEEVIANFPEKKKEFSKIKECYENLICRVEFDYRKFSNIKDQKEFALAIKDIPHSGCLFALRSGKFLSPREFFEKANIKALESLLFSDV